MELLFAGSKNRIMHFLHVAFEFSKMLRESGRGSASFITVVSAFNCSQVVTGSSH